MSETLDRISEKAERIGKLKEQQRILDEFLNANEKIPIEMWELIKKIVCKK